MIWDYTTQFYRDSNQPIGSPQKKTVKGFFRGGFVFGRMLAFGKRLVP